MLYIFSRWLSDGTNPEKGTHLTQPLPGDSGRLRSSMAVKLSLRDGALRIHVCNVVFRTLCVRLPDGTRAMRGRIPYGAGRS